jgi:hypothetical protein
MSTINLSGIEAVDPWEGGGAILPPGDYLVTCSSADVGETSTGKPQIEVQLEAANGLGIRDWIVVTPKSLGRVKFILAAGFGVDLAKVNIDNFDPSILVGRKTSILVATEPRRDDPTQTRTVVQAYRPVGEHPGDRQDVPADTSGLPGNGSAAADDDVPF